MSEADNKELNLLFIEEELSQHGEWLCDAFTEAIEKQKLILTQDLHDSINYSTFNKDGNPGLRINFLSYGRAFEIAGYKRKNKKHEVDTNREVWGIKLNRQQEKKNTQWYARNMYGGLNRLVSRIMYGLSDVEIARLKSIIENRKQQIHG
ncbi:hypothetical protein EZS27_022871 [termite gut metagenome]|uniref:Uncharacterized protein n=1 Tax=termite gut metagenome TaxID=433724 RepID=A0A5J4R4H2_9ZZZZ